MSTTLPESALALRCESIEEVSDDGQDADDEG